MTDTSESSSREGEYRRRWMRPNAHLYIKPDAYRYMPAGTPCLLGADATRYFWPGAKKETPRQESSAAIRADSDQLSQARTELAILRAEFKFRRFLRALKANFNRASRAMTVEGGRTLVARITN
jgi:hypothetical protein